MNERYERMLAELPEGMQNAVRTEAMQRIGAVDMNCGMNYTSYPNFVSISPYSRLEHSIGTAWILWKTTGNPAISYAGLFHDIATPVFSHVIDFLNGDYETQESTEALTGTVIHNSQALCRILESEQIPLSAAEDYHQYPLADNASPRLCADRLEYTMGNLINYGFAEESLVNQFWNDLSIQKDEHGNPEYGFETEELCLKFGLLALKCSEVYSAPEDRYGMERLARLLKQALAEEVLTRADFMTTEPEVIGKLKQSSLKKEWDAFTALHELEFSCHGTEAAGWLQVSCKKRMINPLIHGVRLSMKEESFRKALEEYRQESFEIYMREKSEYE